MPSLFLLHCFGTAALVGLIWVVQLVVYPSLKIVGAAEFKSYHEAHMRRITWVVAPLMLLELGSLALLMLRGGAAPWLSFSLWPLLGIWASTAFVQVPLHRVLEKQGKIVACVERLVVTNWARTALWTLRGVLLFFVAVEKAAASAG